MEAEGLLPGFLARRVSAALRASARWALAAAGFAAAVLALAGLPLLVSETTGRLVLEPGRVLGAAGGFLRAFADGSAFVFRSGYTSWDFRALGPRFLWVSFAYTALPGALGIGIGAFVGSAFRTRRRAAWDRLADFVLATPDFLIIFLAQLCSTWLVDALGPLFPRPRSPGPFAVLPMALMSLFPALLAYRAAATASRRVEGEPFVAFARAKGLPERTVLRRHVGAALIPAIEAELPVIIAFMQGSLFFTEKAFGIPGMARLLYDSAFAGRRRVVLRAIYQYDHVVLSLLGLAVSCVATYCALRLSLSLARRALTRE